MASRPEHIEKDRLASIIQPVILGADYSAYAYVRAFWEAYGVKPIILGCYAVKAISKTRFATYRVVEGLDTEERLLPELRTLGEELCSAGRAPFLVTCGDFYARIISQHKAELEQWFYTPVVDFPTLDFVTQKENFYKVCDEIGVRYPKTRFLDCSDTQAAVDDSGFTYPLVAKPSNSAAYHYVDFPDQQKVFFVQERAELERIYRELQNSAYDESLIVQEFVPGGDEQLYAVYTYADSNSDPVFTICGHVGLEDHHPGAIGNAVVIAPEPNAEIEEAAARFMKRVGYRGMGCFDVKVDPRDGSYRFLEMNTRPGRSSWLVLLAGINFARIQVEQTMLGVEPEPIAPQGGWVYVGVPKRVVAKYMTDCPFKERVLAAYDSGEAHPALSWEADCLAQRFWSSVNFWHQVTKFDTYFPKPDKA